MSVEQNLEEIMAARFGKDVRKPIHDAIYDINEVAKKAEFDASTAPASAKAYAAAALASEQAAQNAKQAAEEAAQQAMSGTPAGYADLVEEVRSLKVSNDTVLAEAGTFVGRVLLDKMYGMSIQDGTPTPSVPVAINSAKANFTNRGKNLIYPYSLADIKTQSTAGTWTNNTYNRVGIDFTVNEDNTITVNGTASGASYFFLSQSPSLNNSHLPHSINAKLVLNGNKSLENIGVSFSNNGNTLAAINATETGETNVSNSAILPDIYSGSTTLYLYVPSGKTVDNVTVSLMIITEDVTDYTYEPYQGQSVTTDLVLRAIEVTSSDDYNLVKDGKYYVADTLEKIDGGYQITRRCDTVTFDGTEGINWQGSRFKYREVNDIAKFNNKLPEMYSHNVVAKGYSNRLIADSNDNMTYNNILAFTFYISSIEFRYQENASTSADFNTWLQSNNIEVVYILKTPYVETVSNADAKKLLSLKSYNEATYIAQAEDTEGVLVLEYGTTNFATKALSGYVEAEQNSIRLDDLEE